MHELRDHEHSSFLTLTYASEHLPPGGSLRPRDFTLFMKRLRKSLPSDRKIRYFHCGEYGEKAGRPHYHAILFGDSFDDQSYEARTTDLGHKVWRSRRLDRLWGLGLCEVGSVTFESCAYVARYVTKKFSGPTKHLYYTHTDEKTGEVFDLVPEYATMSRRPGIGALHFQKFRHEIYPSDEVIVRGKPSKPPKFYDKLLEKTDPAAYALLKDERESALSLSPTLADRSPSRLEVRHVVKRAQIQQLQRKFEK